MVGDGDIENIFGNGDFDVCAEFTILGTAKPLCVNGIFTDATTQSNLMSGEIEVVNPMLDCPTSAVTDVRGGKDGGMVTINGSPYKVDRKQDLGIGITTLHLKTNG